ncbi:leucine-rich repeat domain-containing protein [Mongoliitalea daihaiensis]|uniref:leucine-rich repeat domain-containing protein n=1 Tax=Mongoliitalea daihaiensis TaxID=2782006 RepID=UPI001F3B73B7|nr:leucine-rich repeat domain-containing protein [Mongoliitalea daihaiensis]UJP64315.1 leucine-rich repeat domain-containing protein [Mongoliitalea daihaiensis]
MIKNKFYTAFFSLFLLIIQISAAQDIKGYSKQELKDLSSQVEDQIRFLEYFLNTVGSKDTPARDKDVIIRESYTKIFRDGKVQVEDDLLNDRKVITNKDITAYLKDIEFFFKDANFKFKIREVKPFLRDNEELSFLVSMDRTLTATGLNKEKITNTKPRFLEINVDKKSNELKIASIYTTKLSRDQELQTWWSNLSYTWENYFRNKVGLQEMDSVTIDHLYKISAIDSVDLTGNLFVVDLEPLEALRDLKYIDISNTKIQDLSPISNVTFLSYLNIANTPTNDIQFIKYSDRLAFLDISNTQITDISELGNLKQLHTLKAVNTPIISFDVLNSFGALRVLNVRESGFNNMENIAELSELIHLDISKNFVINFDLLENLSSLVELNVSETNISSLEPLKTMQNLAMVNFNQTEIAELSPLQNKLSLRRVYADLTRISEESADEFARANRRVLLVHHVENLQTWYDGLSVAWREVLEKNNPNLQKANPTIEDLTATVGIDSLIVSGSAITNLAPVLKFRKLNYLDFSQTSVADITPLSEMRMLQCVVGKETNVRSLRALANLNGLRRIDFARSPIQEILSLVNMVQLEYLNIDGATFDEDQVSEFLVKNESVAIIYRTAVLEAWWESMESDWKSVIQKHFGDNTFQPHSELLHSWTSTPSFSIEKVSIENLEPLIIFNNLRKLSIFDVYFRDIEAVSQLKLLEELKISQAPITDLEVLGLLVDLKSLDLSNTGITDLRPLAKLQNLTYLNISGTNIKSLRGLETMQKLEELNIASTNVRSLRPIQGLANLKRLSAFNTRISVRAIDSFRKLNPTCEIKFY